MVQHVLANAQSILPLHTIGKSRVVDKVTMCESILYSLMKVQVNALQYGISSFASMGLQQGAS